MCARREATVWVTPLMLVAVLQLEEQCRSVEGTMEALRNQVKLVRGLGVQRPAPWLTAHCAQAESTLSARDQTVAALQSALALQQQEAETTQVQRANPLASLQLANPNFVHSCTCVARRRRPPAGSDSAPPCRARSTTIRPPSPRYRPAARRSCSRFAPRRAARRRGPRFALAAPLKQRALIHRS